MRLLTYGSYASIIAVVSDWGMRMREETGSVSSPAVETRLGSGHYEWDVAGDRLTWSPGLLAIYGLEAPPNAEEGFTRLVHPDDRTRVEAETSTFLQQGDVYEHDFRIIRPDGEVRHVLDRGVIERSADGSPIRLSGVNLDITERKSREEALRSEHDAFRDLVEGAPIGICVVDADLKVLYASAGANAHFADGRPVTGCDLAELQYAIWPKAFAEEVLARCRHTLGTGERYHTCTSVERRDRGVVEVVEWQIQRHIMPDGRPGLFGYFQDLTDHHRREAELEESRKRLEMAYEIAGIGAWDLDLPTDRSVWSPQLYALLGLDPATPASSAIFFDQVHPEDLPRLKEAYGAAIEDRSLFDAEFRIIRRDGEVRHIAGLGRVVSEQDGAPGRVIGVNYDVTEKRDAVGKLRLVMREVNHRSKNLLSLVQAIARQTWKSDPDYFVTRLNERLQSLAAAHDLLVEGEYEGAALARLVETQLTFFGDLLGNRIRLSGPDVQVTAEAAQTLGMAFHELATNAAKHGALSNGRGTVDVTWQLEDDGAGSGLLVLSWVERDGPPVTPPERTGFGGTVLDQIVSSSLQADVEMNFASEGFSWRLSCGESCISPVRGPQGEQEPS